MSGQRVVDAALLAGLVAEVPWGEANGWGNNGPLWREIAGRLLEVAPPLVGSQRQVAVADETRRGAAERVAQILCCTEGEVAMNAATERTPPRDAVVQRRAERRVGTLANLARLLASTSAPAWVGARATLPEAIGWRWDLCAQFLDDMKF